MRGVYFISLVATIIFATGFWYTNTAHLCPIPVTYRLGEVDDRFPITREEILEVLAKAEAVWEEPLGFDLFVYDETSTFPVNFIYDERQQMAATQEQWELALDAKQVQYESVLAEVKSSAARYETKSASYTTMREEYEAALAIYNQTVEDYDANGGVPEGAYPALRAEESRLQKQLSDLIAEDKALRVLSQELNALADRGNAMIEKYNGEVEQYNEVYGQPETFTQGDFARSRINIYKFTDTEELTQVIAHEFGHALGIGHVEGEASVMYYLNTERDFPSLSVTDQAAFSTACGDQNTWPGRVRQLIRTILQTINQ
jgi:Matrixin